MREKRNIIHYHLMLLPAFILVCIFTVKPLAGSILAFKNFNPTLGIFGSPWAGLEHFKTVFKIPVIGNILYNTVFIALLKIIFSLIVPLAFALLLNEVRKMWFKRTVQTIVYLPYFLSWVILAGIFKDILAMDGVVNKLLGDLLGLDPIMFLGKKSLFPAIMVATDVWKNFGFNAIVYLAALTAVDPGLYEACEIDGGGRWRQLFHITLPCIRPTIILLATLSLQGILNAGFEQILNFYSPLVYDTGDILDTYIYRMGLLSVQYELATALGLMRSVVALLLTVVSQYLAGKLANYTIF